MRMTIYLDNLRERVREIHEWFENRTDKLYRRSRYPIDNRSHDYFHPGSVVCLALSLCIIYVLRGESQGEIKEWIEYFGHKRTIYFYINGRLDRLKQRDEQIGKKSIDIFEGRTDQLTYRSAVYSAEKYISCKILQPS